MGSEERDEGGNLKSEGLKFMNTPKTAGGGAVGLNNRFAPFDADGILRVQDGKITTELNEDRGWTEYHLENMHGDVWLIERSDTAEQRCSFVYQGRIPDRAFFVAVMTNQEMPPPDGWANEQGQPPRLAGLAEPPC
jgi:hypothetical protein